MEQGNNKGRLIIMAVACICVVIIGVVIAIAVNVRENAKNSEIKQGIKIDGSESVKTKQEEIVETPKEEHKTDEDKNDTLDTNETEDDAYNKNASSNLGDNKALSIEILDDIYAEQQCNVMYSPISLNMALGVAAEGAKESTRESIDTFLGTPLYSDFSKGYLTKQVPKFNKNVEGYGDWDSGYSTVFEVANSIWIDQSLNIDKAYKNKVETCYNAMVNSVDFGDANKTCEKVNKWCDEKTRGMIPSILSPDSINKDTSSVIANSVYFESSWVEPWNVADEAEKFTMLDGSEENVTYIENYSGYYYENENAKAFCINYINGMKFIGILPNKIGEFTLSELDIPNLLKNKQSNNVEVDIKMPKLNFETTSMLKDILTNKGLDIIFSDDADFTGITESKESLNVGEIIQKTKIELDENGTKAAAVTAMLLETCGIFEEETPRIVEIHLDRPFAYMIYDEENDQVIFVGKVVQPE